jgi:hypothetical protein
MLSSACKAARTKGLKKLFHSLEYSTGSSVTQGVAAVLHSVWPRSRLGGWIILFMESLAHDMTVQSAQLQLYRRYE